MNFRGGGGHNSTHYTPPWPILCPCQPNRDLTASAMPLALFHNKLPHCFSHCLLSSSQFMVSRPITLLFIPLWTTQGVKASENMVLETEPIIEAMAEQWDRSKPPGHSWLGALWHWMPVVTAHLPGASRVFLQPCFSRGLPGLLRLQLQQFIFFIEV